MTKTIALSAPMTRYVLVVAMLAVVGPAGLGWIGRVRCSIERPMRRELQSNKTVFMHTCVKKDICKQYIEQNALNHIDCESLCDLSWKWAHSEPGTDPLITLPPEEGGVRADETDDFSEGMTWKAKPKAANFMVVIGSHKMAHSEGSSEPREKESWNRRQIGRAGQLEGSENVVKAMEQKVVEVKSRGSTSTGAPGSDDKAESEDGSEKREENGEGKKESADDDQE